MRCSWGSTQYACTVSFRVEDLRWMTSSFICRVFLGPRGLSIDQLDCRALMTVAHSARNIQPSVNHLDTPLDLSTTVCTMSTVVYCRKKTTPPFGVLAPARLGSSISVNIAKRPCHSRRLTITILTIYLPNQNILLNPVTTELFSSSTGSVPMAKSVVCTCSASGTWQRWSCSQDDEIVFGFLEKIP